LPNMAVSFSLAYAASESQSSCSLARTRLVSDEPDVSPRGGESFWTLVGASLIDQSRLRLAASFIRSGRSPVRDGMFIEQ
jgi:hypothetical protein